MHIQVFAKLYVVQCTYSCDYVCVLDIRRSSRTRPASGSYTEIPDLDWCDTSDDVSSDSDSDFDQTDVLDR